MRKFFLNVFILIAIAATAAWFYTYRQLDAERARATVLEKTITSQDELLTDMRVAREELAARQASVAALQRAADAASNRVAELETQLAAAAAPPAPQGAAAQTNVADAAAAAPEKKTAGAQFTDSLATMMRNPEMKDAIREQLKVALDPIYGPLIRELNLSPEEAEAFRDLLVERQVAVMDMSMDLMKPGMDSEQRKELTGRIDEERNKVNDMIRELLGDGQYERYKAYQETEQERLSLSQFKQQLVMADTSIDRTQEDQLVQAMADERKDMAKDPAYLDLQKEPPSGFTQEIADRWAKQQAMYNERVLQRAAGILGKQQLDAFRTFQENQMRLQQMQMKMAVSMFGSSEAPQKE